MQVQLLFSNIVNYVHTADEKWGIIEKVRNKILLNVGWVSTSDTLTTIEREAGLDYIQALKDIPQNFISPDDVVFPTPPIFLENWVSL